MYHAISMNLFGSEINSFKIKLLTVFMHFEYEDFFRKFLHRYCYEYDFESLIKNASKLGVWGSEMRLIAISFLLRRPVYCYERNASFTINPMSFSSRPVVIFLQDDHFIAGLRWSHQAEIVMPRADRLASFPDNDLPFFNDYF